MAKEYSITYTASNKYENWVQDAYWQFLIIPMQNVNQRYIQVDFENSLHAVNEFSVNGFDFQTIRVHPKKRFKEIDFNASFKLLKDKIDPFDFEPEDNISKSYEILSNLTFKIDHEPFLKRTAFTDLSKNRNSFFEFDKSKAVFDNLMALNSWTSAYLKFQTSVTDVTTTVDKLVKIKQGVCQDFTHLFCTLARKNGVPTRYVSGYLNQGNGFLGDSQMHAWAEAYVPQVGWKGFDPTNNILVNQEHIKVCHGKDYNDCSPLKGIIYSHGKNTTTHAVMINSQQ